MLAYNNALVTHIGDGCIANILKKLPDKPNSSVDISNKTVLTPLFILLVVPLTLHGKAEVIGIFIKVLLKNSRNYVLGI